MDHEPCKSRGDCYHARGARNQPRDAKVRAGRNGARNQPREAKVRGGRNGARMTNMTWGKTFEAREAESRGGRRAQAIWGKTPEGREAKIRGGLNQPREAKVRGGRNGGSIRARITNATWGKTPEAYEVRFRAGHNGGIKTAEIHRRQKPNRQEATVAALFMTFHPDVWADIIWQRHLPQSLRGVPDIRHPTKVVGEYDGDGHGAFGDRSSDDAVKDAERRAVGYTVVRETDPYVLVAKFAYAVRGRFR